jgi:hypothetical protein
LAELPSPGIAIGRERENQDGAGRVVAYVWPADGRPMVNEQLIAEGYARARNSSPNVKYAERFGQAEQAAQGGQLGLWSACLQNPNAGEGGAVIDSDTGPSAPSTSERSSQRSHRSQQSWMDDLRGGFAW